MEITDQEYNYNENVAVYNCNYCGDVKLVNTFEGEQPPAGCTNPYCESNEGKSPTPGLKVVYINYNKDSDSPFCNNCKEEDCLISGDGTCAMIRTYRQYCHQKEYKMKNDIKLVLESIKHWQRIKNECRKFLDEGHHNYSPCYNYTFYKLVIDEPINSEGCPLCLKYLPDEKNGIQHCDCNHPWSAWTRTVRNKNTLETFIESIENIMLPALYECLKICGDK